jgi:hypothetical protein
VEQNRGGITSSKCAQLAEQKNLEDIYLKNKAFEIIISESFSFTNYFIYLSVVKFYNILKGRKKTS